MRWILACVVLLIMALVWEEWLARTPLDLPVQAAGEAEHARSEAAAAELEAPRVPPRAELPAAAPAAPEAEPAAAEDLLAQLERVAVAYGQQDTLALGSALTPLIGTPARCEEALLLLEQGGLREHEIAQHGALLVLGTALSCYSAPQSGLRVDGRAFTERVLAGLADVLPPEQFDLAEQLIQAQVGERYLLDLTYLPKIIELRGRHPDQAEVYSSLLVHMSEGLADEVGLEQFRALFLTQNQDPTAVKLALSALLRADAASWLPLAEDLFADARENPALRGAIAFAIANSAPVELAAASLARLATQSMYGEFSLLGLREGGSEALAARYSELVAAGGNSLSRRMLVSGLRTEAEPVLVGIARTDPDPSVRTQALLTSSLGRPSGSELLDELEAQHRLRTDPAHGIPSSNAVLVAGNVLVNSSGAEQERAREFLMRLAADPSESDSDRLAAVRTVRNWMPAGTFDSWVIGGQPLK